MNAHLGEVLNLYVHNLVGQTELGDTILQHTADFVQRLEDIDVVALLHHIASKRQTGRTGTHDGHLDAVGGCNLRQRDVAALALVVGSKALQIADSHGGFVHLQVDTLALALLLLRTDTTADGRQGRGGLQHFGGSQELAALDVLDERRNIDVHRTTLHA